ncbi:MAG TPA: hypothetical protein VG225_00105 [Terracidiphilus sp.]|jgi:hypothetical protein|nr:hypothetical protein [Terracidiphilus sp.]
MDTQAPVLSAGQVISWWEWRRLAFNAALLLIGIAALIGFEILMEKSIPPGEDAEEPMGLLLGVIAYGFMANVCYTFGWIFELILRQADPASARELGKKMFRVGMFYSWVLTTAPFWFGVLFYILRSNRFR